MATLPLEDSSPANDSNSSMHPDCPQKKFDDAMSAYAREENLQAIELLVKCWQSAENNLDLKLDAAIQLGEIATMGTAETIELATPILTEALELARDGGSKRKHAATLHLMALIFRRVGNVQGAKELLNQSPILSLGDRPSRELGQYFHCRALLKDDEHLTTSAERDSYRAYQFYEEANDPAGISRVCDTLAGILLKLGKTESALEFCEKSLKIKSNRRDKKGEAISCGTKGRIHLQQANYDEARKAFERNLAISRETGAILGIGISLNSLGEIDWLSALALNEAQTEQREQGFQRAIENYEKSIEEAKNKVNFAHAHLGIARVLISQNRFEDARAKLGTVQKILDDNNGIPGSEEFRLTITGLNGAIHWRCHRSELRSDQKILEESVALLRQAIEGLKTRPKSAIDAVPFLYELRDLHTEQNNIPRAVEILAEAVAILSENGALSQVQSAENWFRNHDQSGLFKLALQRHVPDFIAKHVAEGALMPKRAERQRVTSLFCDIRGFTSLTEKMSPEAIVALLNEWLGEATRCIQKNGGYVDKFAGDAVMGVFGADKGLEHSGAANAVRAALDMSEALWAMNLRRQTLRNLEPTSELELKPVRVGIGLASGDVVIGFVGSYRRYTYTVHGDAVNTASRLESATKEFAGCEILISEQTELDQRAEAVAETRFVGHVKVPGKDNVVPTYEVLGRRSGPTSTE
ncbi:MAG: tetratricopeptide repeat protein [Planctomycetales bacterium]|nr:tetratricopeptide repeat protein [Planctomycetales bacterium]